MPLLEATSRDRGTEAATLDRLRARLPDKARDLLDGVDGNLSEWSTASAIAIYAMNVGLTEDEFVRVVTASDFACEFATENGRDRSDRLEARLRKAWAKAEDAWNPPLGSIEEVRRQLEALSNRAERHPWAAKTARVDRAIALALIAWAHELGTWVVGANQRDLSVRAGVARSTVGPGLSRLAAAGLVRRADHDATEDRSRRWQLHLRWGISPQLSPYVPLPPTGETYGLTSVVNHPAFVGGALGQTVERVWLDIASHPDTTASETAERLGLPARRVGGPVRKLIDHGMVLQTGTRVEGRGKPPATYALNPHAPTLDSVAETYGVADWHERTAERYHRERGGYRAVQRQTHRHSPPLPPEPADERRQIEDMLLMEQLGIAP